MPYKQKLGAEKNTEIIRDCLNKIINKREATRRGGIAQDTISHWTGYLGAEGVKAFLTHKARVYRPELKLHAVEDYLFSMGSQTEICRKYYI